MKSITLSAQEETVLRQLYNNYTQVLGPQISGIPLPFFLQFVWSRNLINNGFSFPLIRDIFYEAAGQGVGGESGFGGEFLTQAKFYNAIMLIAERLFTQDPMPINSLFTKILIESDIPEDEETLQLLSDEAIDVYIETSPGFRSLMVAFNSENIKARSVVSNWSQILYQNSGVTARNLLRATRILGIIPQLINVETFQEILEATTPGGKKVFGTFFEDCILVRDFEEEEN